MRTIIKAGAILVLGLALAAGYFAGARWAVDQPLTLQSGTPLPDPRPVAPFELVDQHGTPFTLEQLTGHWSLLFLGFTHCPDVCPQTLTVLNAAGELLEAGEGGRVRTVFVSVDPDRDKPELLAEYVGYFNPEFIAVTGSKSQLDQLSESLGFAYVMVPTSQGRYTVDHSTAVALINPDARVAAYFRQPLDVEAMASDLKRLSMH